MEVPTISPRMADVVRGNANLSQLAIQWPYRAVNAQDMARIYSRDVARRRLCVPTSAQSDFAENKDLEEVMMAHPIFLEPLEASGGDIFESQGAGELASG